MLLTYRPTRRKNDVTALYKELPKKEEPKDEPEEKQQQPAPIAETASDLVQTGIEKAPYIIIAVIAIVGVSAIIMKKSRMK